MAPHYPRPQLTGNRKLTYRLDGEKGHNMKFSKKRMIQRLTREGKTDKITPDIETIMDNLDGQEATASCWNRQVYGEPVLYVIGKDGKGEYVNESDCI